MKNNLVFLISILFSCNLTQKANVIGAKVDDPVMRLSNMAKLIDSSDKTQGYEELRSALLPDQRLRTEGYFTVSLINEERLQYFLPNGVGRIITGSDDYYVALWDIFLTDKKENSLLSKEEKDDAFMLLNAKGELLATGEKEENSVAYFKIGKNVAAAEYTISVHITDGKNEEFETYERVVNVIPAFSFPQGLRLSAHASSYFLRGKPENSGEALPLDKVLLNVSDSDSRKATSDLYLRRAATVAKPLVFFFDFTVNDEDYRVSQYAKGAVLRDTPAKILTTRVVPFDDPNKTVADDAKSPIENFAVGFNVTENSYVWPHDRRGRVHLTIVDNYGQEGEIVVDLYPTVSVSE